MFTYVLAYQDSSDLDTFQTACEAAMTELKVDGGSQVGPTPINNLKLYIAQRMTDVSFFKYNTLDGATPNTYPTLADQLQWETDMRTMLDAAR